MADAEVWGMLGFGCWQWLGRREPHRSTLGSRGYMLMSAGFPGEINAEA
jgi:hypothetical protein